MSRVDSSEYPPFVRYEVSGGGATVPFSCPSCSVAGCECVMSATKLSRERGSGRVHGVRADGERVLLSFHGSRPKEEEAA